MISRQEFWEKLGYIFERFDIPCKFCPVEGESGPMCATSCEQALKNVYERLEHENK